MPTSHIYLDVGICVVVHGKEISFTAATANLVKAWKNRKSKKTKLAKFHTELVCGMQLATVALLVFLSFPNFSALFYSLLTLANSKRNKCPAPGAINISETPRVIVLNILKLL